MDMSPDNLLQVDAIVFVGILIFVSFTSRAFTRSGKIVSIKWATFLAIPIFLIMLSVMELLTYDTDIGSFFLSHDLKLVFAKTTTFFGFLTVFFIIALLGYNEIKVTRKENRENRSSNSD